MKYKNFLITLLIPVFLTFVLSPSVVLAAPNFLMVQPAPGPSSITKDYDATIFIDDYDDYPNATYYTEVVASDGTSYRRLTTVNESSITGVTGSFLIYGGATPETQYGPNAKVYVYRDNDRDGTVDEYIVGLNYDFSTNTGGEVIYNDPSIPGGGDTEAPPEPSPEDPGDAGSPSDPGDLAEIDYDSKIMDFSALATRFLIGIAIFASVFLLPYIGVLMASGNPENINKGKEWLFSWLSGLLFLLMSGIIVRLIGSEILNIAG